MKITQEQIEGEVLGTLVSNVYTIVDARVKEGCFSDSDHFGIALGRKPGNTSKYVTWEFNFIGGELSFNHGHYTSNEHLARADYYLRDHENYPGFEKFCETYGSPDTPRPRLQPEHDRNNDR